MRPQTRCGRDQGRFQSVGAGLVSLPVLVMQSCFESIGDIVNERRGEFTLLSMKLEAQSISTMEEFHAFKYL
tara:strand:+ start:469 stop:684 length:216 start_codon:yes stop_codon:yes gene_type:complete